MSVRREIIATLVYLVGLVGLVVGLQIVTRAHGRDAGQWEATDPETSAWYRNLMQPDNPGASCCGEADAYWADGFEVSKDGEYIAIVTDERDDAPLGRPHIAVGTRIVVPHHKLKFDEGNPTGHGVIFVKWIGEEESFDGWGVYCYVAPGGV